LVEYPLVGGVDGDSYLVSMPGENVNWVKAEDALWDFGRSVRGI
jgi:hypothetical protein